MWNNGGLSDTHKISTQILKNLVIMKEKITTMLEIDWNPSWVWYCLMEDLKENQDMCQRRQRGDGVGLGIWKKIPGSFSLEDRGCREEEVKSQETIKKVWELRRIQDFCDEK